jgi:UDP-glucose 4-epimerase
VTAVVTGGAGFIGSHLVDRLIEAGEAVTVIDDLSNGRRENLAGAIERGARLVESDVAELDRTAAVIAEASAATVFHLAAQASVTRSVREPAFDARTNVIGTIAVLEAARAAGSPVVNISTGGAIYGEPAERSLPFAEDAEPRVEAPYAASKLSAEHYVELYRRLHGVTAVTLRLANIYGPRQDPDGEAGVVAIFCGRLLAEEPVTIFGDGTQTRDYTYVDDVVDALLTAADRLGGKGLDGLYNIGTGVATSVLELHETLAGHAGSAAAPVHADARPGEISASVLDCADAARDLGWTAATPLAEGLRITFESFRAGR